MAKLSDETFLDLLRKSQLTEEDKLNAALAAIAEEGDKTRLHDADYLAGMLVRKGLITRWHVRQLMKRKYKGFFLRQYRILDHIGTGGMSTVYLAEHTLMHRMVAIKILPKKRMTNSAYVERFVREAQAIAALNHPNIVQAYDIDRYDDMHYIVMEYFEGNNLRQLVDKEGPLPFEDAVSYIRQGAEGLIHAHRIGVIHRDVKPENILANSEGTAKLLDLGLALLKEEDESGSSTKQDSILGTADYLAPEQAINSSKIDGRADIYSLGCTLYFCLTGHPPFPFGTIPQRLLAHQRETPASILIDRPDCPDDLVDICCKMMAKKPEDRFQTAQEVTDILGRWLIHHGYAQPEELGMKMNEGEDSSEAFFSGSFADPSDPWNATGLSEREEDHQIGIGGENVVNLYGSSLGSGSMAESGDERNTDEFVRQPSDMVLSRRAARDNMKADPLEMALDDIKTGQTGENSAISLAGAAAASAAHSARPVKKPEKPRKEKRSRLWYKEVPVWFWTLFVAGYVLAIIMGCFFFISVLFQMK
ncbi:MAG: serine/threonine protein kinase [Thermoguttaceae bacterium]|nr:serine/threonine protein kinase [Thermoguttaceae bacterium]